jgi:hypothetical protein
LFAVQFLLEPAERLFDGFASFDFNFGHKWFLPTERARQRLDWVEVEGLRRSLYARLSL